MRLKGFFYFLEQGSWINVSENDHNQIEGPNICLVGTTKDDIEEIMKVKNQLLGQNEEKDEGTHISFQLCPSMF
jgi:hypothetical protein